ncbi:uncharacterized protein LOC121235117 isoform X1 [Juglans microcarpa x Juglans regia]|uniref:uncharacterized protein LOC121235117 isoform X1 n=1 Tax=Juglans microcarpa x Juglans regia TaxID=2249226 RepID=UPI001B7E434A|nr:uncharacterized protein LOC121235117 isoform X1 [Juglans microcarpa x Juglans regia]
MAFKVSFALVLIYLIIASIIFAKDVASREITVVLDQHEQKISTVKHGSIHTLSSLINSPPHCSPHGAPWNRGRGRVPAHGPPSGCTVNKSPRPPGRDGHPA